MIRLENLGISISNNIMHIANLAPAYSFEFGSLSDVVRTILSSEHRRIPIVSKKQELVGIITYMDILDALLRGLSRNTRISVFMTREVIFCEPDEVISTVLQKIKISRRDGLPVVKKMKLIGIVTEHDFVMLISGKYLSTPVSEVMTHKPFFITSNTSIHTCMKTMVNTHYRRLPIVNNKELVGIITTYNVLNYLNDINYNSTFLNENISSIMSTPVVFVTEQDDISDAIRRMKENHISGLPVINEENMLTGIITERDILELL